MTDLSVIIVSYDSAGCISKCLQSILREPRVGRVIVIDNASADNSQALLRDWAAREPRVQLVENTRNLGFAVAVNQGLQRVESEFTLLLNPDCVVGANTIRRVLEVLRSQPTTGMAGCMIRNVDGSEQRGCRRYSPTLQRVVARFTRREQTDGERTAGFEQHLEPVPEAPTEVEAISGAFMCVRRTAIEQVGLLDEGYFLHAEDLDWCLRFRKAGWRILFVPDVQAVHDRGFSSRQHLMTVHWHMHRGMLRYYGKFLAPESSALINVAVAVGIGTRYLFLLPLIPLRALRFRMRARARRGR